MDKDKNLESDQARNPEKKHRLLETVMKAADKSSNLWGPADRGDADAPVVHKHDEFEAASEEDLAEFEVEIDDSGHRYGVRKTHEPD